MTKRWCGEQCIGNADVGAIIDPRDWCTRSIGSMYLRYGASRSRSTGSA